MKNQEKKNQEKKKPNIWAFLFAVAIVGSVFSTCIGTEEEEPKTRTELVQDQFSVFNGAHRKLQQHVKKNLKDPDSYEHIGTRHEDKGEYILVSMKYRAKNSFGGFVVEYVTVKVDINGNILEFIE